MTFEREGGRWRRKAADGHLRLGKVHSRGGDAGQDGGHTLQPQAQQDEGNPFRGLEKVC